MVALRSSRAFQSVKSVELKGQIPSSIACYLGIRPLMGVTRCSKEHPLGSLQPEEQF